MISLLLIILTVITIAMAGANNAGNSAGTVAGSKVTSYRNGILIFVVGLAAGALLEGGKLVGAIQGRALLGTVPSKSIEIILGVTLAMIFVATAFRLPLPITQAVFGASIGSGIYLGLAFNMPGITTVLVSWVITPFLAALASFMLSKIMHRRTINSVGGSVMVYGILTLVASFYTAYSFGANTLGLIAGVISDDLGWFLAIGISVVAAGIGGIIVGERVSRTIGERVSSLGPSTAFASQVGAALTVHIFTQGGIPVSISHAIIGGVSGGALAKGTKALSGNTTSKLLVLWVFMPILSVGMAWLLQAVTA